MGALLECEHSVVADAKSLGQKGTQFYQERYSITIQILSSR